MKKYISDNYEFSDKRNQEHMLEVEIEDGIDTVVCIAPTMTVYFEEEIQNLLEKTYPGKECKIGYRSSMSLKFYDYRHFMGKLPTEKVKDLDLAK